MQINHQPRGVVEIPRRMPRNACRKPRGARRIVATHSPGRAIGSRLSLFHARRLSIPTDCQSLQTIKHLRFSDSEVSVLPPYGQARPSCHPKNSGPHPPMNAARVERPLSSEMQSPSAHINRWITRWLQEKHAERSSSGGSNLAIRLLISGGTHILVSAISFQYD